MSDEDVKDEAAEAVVEEKDEAGDKPKASEVETLATEMGWAPKDQWRGDPAKWVDAKTFIKTGPEILKTSLRQQDAKLADVQQTIKDLHEHYSRSEQRAYAKAIADLKAKQREAVASGDTEAFDAVSDEIEKLGKDATTAAEKPKDAKPNPDEDPAFKSWHGSNEWYGPDGDVEATAYAEQIAAVVGRKYQGAEFYRKITEEVRKKFPDKFENANRGKAPRVENAGGAGSGRRGSGKAYADLPAEAKAACDRFVKQGLMKRDDYVKDYFAEENAA